MGRTGPLDGTASAKALRWGVLDIRSIAGYGIRGDGSQGQLAVGCVGDCKDCVIHCVS